MMVEFAVNDEVKDFELRLHDHNGEVVWGLASLATIEMEHEDLLLFGFNDVSRLKQVEMELSAANSELEELADIKNKFLGMAAHDLRAPISAIRGMSELISTLDLAEAKKTDLVSSIMTVSDQMLGLLNDLLDVSAIENGTFDLDMETGDLGELLRQRIGLISFTADAKGIAIETIVDSDIEYQFDHNRIAQVIDNLLTNAVKFSKRGQKVEASVVVKDSDVVLSVCDHGVGIPEAEIDRLFVPFEKLSSRPTEGESSTGLGLSIAKRIVDAHDGDISVESNEGQGSRFIVSLPQVTAASDRAAYVKDNEPKEPFAADRSAHILIVDDNDINRRIIAAILDEIGHTYEQAENGARAIEMHRSGDFDLILMDVQMPVLSGTDATQVIRNMRGAKSIVPIIALTANDTKSCRDEYLEIGMNIVMTKPANQIVLTAAVNEALTL